jgi:hypothetical protein
MAHYFLQGACKLPRAESWRSQAGPSSIYGRQPKAATLDRQAKESRNWKAGQGHQQAKTTAIGQVRIAEH